MTIEMNTRGGYVISTIHKGQYIRRTYYGYTKREAMRLFREYVRELSA